MRHGRTLRAFIALAALLLGMAAAEAASWQDKVAPSVLAAAAAGRTEFLVYLAEQADLSAAPAEATKLEKGRWTFAQLTGVAGRTQPAVTSLLGLLGAEHRAFWIVNALLVQGDLATVQALALRADVARIEANASGRRDEPVSRKPGKPGSDAEWNLKLVGADEVWRRGYTGQGVVVAGADSGVEWTHPALQSKYRGWNGATADHSYNWHDAIPTPNTECPGSSPAPCDDDAILGGGHGTHTMGTMVGDGGPGNRVGMAPGARWIACRNMIYGAGTVATYLDCMQWFLAPTDSAGANPDPARAPHVINNSWACVEACPPDVLRQGTEALRAAGIVYVASAGNFGPECSTIAFAPATYTASFVVGATDSADLIAEFSSRGPVLVDPSNPLLRKPDVSAPGVDVRSSLKGGSYGELSGTSMSGPHVAGLVALILSANPDLAGDVDRIEEIVEQTVVPLGSDQGCGGDAVGAVPNNVYGFGRIDALAAVRMALRDRGRD